MRWKSDNVNNNAKFWAIFREKNATHSLKNAEGLLTILLTAATF